MRGSPPLHLLLLAAAFMLVALPLWRLTCARPGSHGHTHGGPVVVRGVDDHPEEEHVHHLTTTVRVWFAHRPLSVSLMAGETELLKEVNWAAAEAPVEVGVELEIGHDGNELVLEASWPEGTPLTAVTVELEPEGLETRAETRWATEGEVSDVLTFEW